MPTRSWSELENRILAERPDREARIATRMEQELAEHDRYQHTLAQIRKVRALTQVEVSKIEKRSDLYLSTLARYVEALGGELELVAAFDGERYSLRIGDRVGADAATEEALSAPDAPAACEAMPA